MIERTDGLETSQQMLDRVEGWRARQAALPALVAAAEAEEAATQAALDQRQADLDAAEAALFRARAGYPEDFVGAGVVLRAIDEDGSLLEGDLREATRIAFGRLPATEQRRWTEALTEAVHDWQRTRQPRDEASAAHGTAARAVALLRAEERHLPDHLAQAERELAAVLKREEEQQTLTTRIRKLLGKST